LRALILAAALTACAAPAVAQTPPKPTLIVAIAIDQFSADLFGEYRPLYTQGLKRLSQGVVFSSGYQSHAATETCPGHATILTGQRPARSGIIANNWFDLSIPRADKQIYCSEDPTAPGSTSSNYVVSTGFLKAQTLGDRLKAADPMSRVVAVAGKDRAAVMMGGHVTDQMWFWGGRNFVTLKDRTTPAPAAVTAVNARVPGLLAKDSTDPTPATCKSREQSVQITPEFAVGVIASRKAEDFRSFRTAAAFDQLTADLAINLIGEMKLGQGPSTDLIAIGLSATDYVGHTFGTEGAEMCAQILNIDNAIGRIVAALDKTGAPYVVVLTADHGGHDATERNVIRALPAAERADPALNLVTVSDELAKQFGLTGRVVHGDSLSGEAYVSMDVPAALRPQVIAALKHRLEAHRQIEAAFTAEELRRVPRPTRPPEEWTLAERFSQSFDPARSGDVIFALKPYVLPRANPGYVATHGTPWIYDRRVPILFYRPGSPGFEQPNSVETVDIAPTLAGLIGLKTEAGAFDGRCLDLDAGVGDSCKP